MVIGWCFIVLPLRVGCMRDCCLFGFTLAVCVAVGWWLCWWLYSILHWLTVGDYLLCVNNVVDWLLWSLKSVVCSLLFGIPMVCYLVFLWLFAMVVVILACWWCVNSVVLILTFNFKFKCLWLLLLGCCRSVWLVGGLFTLCCGLVVFACVVL